MGFGHTFISYGYRRYAFQRHHCGRVEKCHSRWSLRNARLPESELHRLDCRHFETSARLEADTAAGTKFLSFFCSFPFHKVYICSSRHLELKRIELDINMSYKIERDWKGFSKSLSQRLCNLISAAWKPKSLKNDWNQNSRWRYQITRSFLARTGAVLKEFLRLFSNKYFYLYQVPMFQ